MIALCKPSLARIPSLSCLFGLLLSGCLSLNSPDDMGPHDHDLDSSGTQLDGDACNVAQCNGHGTCSNYGCECGVGWAGATCSVCAPGYYGETCAICPTCST